MNAELLDDPHLLRHARRVVGQLPHASSERLLIEVALSSCPAYPRLPAAQQEALRQLVLGHASGSYPLPIRGVRYSNHQRDEIRHFSLRGHAELRAYALEVADWERRLAGEIPKAVYEELYGPGGEHHPSLVVASLLGWFQQELAGVCSRERTPSRLRTMWAARARPSLERAWVCWRHRGFTDQGPTPSGSSTC